MYFLVGCMWDIKLTKVFPSPDVHVCVILAQVVEPALVHDKNPTCNDGSSAEFRENKSHLELATESWKNMGSHQ